MIHVQDNTRLATASHRLLFTKHWHQFPDERLFVLHIDHAAPKALKVRNSQA
jgi:hypothetical protein